MTTQLKDELRELQGRREHGVRELGQMAVEMYREDRIDVGRLRGRADEVAVIDQRIRDLQARLRLAAT